MKISVQDQALLQEALYYMKMAELKKVCLMLSLPHADTKMNLITRIMTFVSVGIITLPAVIPATSQAKNYSRQPLEPTALMLYGSYKNDAQARAFFKKIIGNHFHFTAYGIDWLNERWHAGNPPTYQEFADYWIKETTKRKFDKPEPKDEWQYINFLQKMAYEYPDLPKSDLMVAWKKLQAEKARKVFQLLEKYKQTL